MFAFLEFWC